MIEPSSTYEVYGVALQSPIRLPCQAAAPTRHVDVRLRSGAAADFAPVCDSGGSDRSRDDWFVCRRLPDRSVYVGWTGLFEFVISPDGRDIVYRRDRRAADESFSTYLLGQVLSFSLLARGVESLHGTVSVVDGGAVAFLGDCGYGKSTLAAAMLARGFPILTDDLIVMEASADNQWMVQPGIPRLKLFPSVARKLLGPSASGEKMNPGTAKLVIPLTDANASRRAMPLKAIYILAPPPSSSGNPVRNVRIGPLTGADAFVEIVRGAFNLAVIERDRLANQFSFAAALATTVPIRALQYPRRLSSLPSVCDAVLAELASVARDTPSPKNT